MCFYLQQLYLFTIYRIADWIAAFLCIFILYIHVSHLLICTLYTAWPKKNVATKKKRSHTLIFCWTAFSFDYSTHSLWHCFDKLLQCHKIYFHPVLHQFSPGSCIDDGRVRPLRKAFSSTSQSFSMGLRSGLCGDQSMCENDVSCSLNHSFTVWAWWIVALSSWGKKNPPMEKPAHSAPTGLYSRQ